VRQTEEGHLELWEGAHRSAKCDERRDQQAKGSEGMQMNARKIQIWLAKLI
jgi:hypothetical protein